MQPVVESAPPESELNSLSVFTVFIVLAAVTMTFGALIAVFLMRSESGRFWGHIRIPGVLWATTAILLGSSALFELARRRLSHGDQASFFRLMAATTVLGILFLLGQIAAWFQILGSGVVLKDNPHDWFIFLFTGLHGTHIVLGLIGLMYLLVRTHEPASGPRYQAKTRAVAAGVGIFWHYLDFLWLLLFGLLLFWRR